MSYSIIFETKIVNLPDGRILHLDRSGCNNDNCGRTKYDFTGKIYSKESFQEYIERFIDTDNDYEDALKIGSRWCSWNDYAEHLKRMLKRAKSWEELSDGRICEATVFDGVSCYFRETKEDKFLTPKEYEKIQYDVMYGRIDAMVHRKYHRTKDINEIIDCLNDGKPIEFYIGTKHRRKI